MVKETYWGPHTHKWVRGPDLAWHRLTALGMVAAASLVHGHSMTSVSRVPVLGAQRLFLDAASATPDLEPCLRFNTLLTDWIEGTDHSFHTHWNPKLLMCTENHSEKRRSTSTSRPFAQ